MLWLFDFAADFFAVVAAYYTTLLIRFHSEWGAQFFSAARSLLRAGSGSGPGGYHEIFYMTRAPRIISYITIAVCIVYALRNLYSGRKFLRRRSDVWNIILSNVIVLATFYVYFYVKRNVFHPRSFFATVIFLNVLYCVSFRGVTGRFLSFLRSRGTDHYSAILVGSGGETDLISSYIEQLHPHGINIVKNIDLKSDHTFAEKIRQIKDAAEVYSADMIISTDKELSVEQIMKMLELCEELDLTAKILSNKLDVLVLQGRIDSDVINGVPLVHFDAPSKSRRSQGTKKLFSMVFSLFGLILFSPLMLIVALLIKLTSRGSILFEQERIGVNRKPFMMYKFRTMYHKAEEAQAQVEEFNESGKGLFKIKKDPRVTLVGRFLRRFSLDELPQLLNVLHGDMTLVGPRPLPRRDFSNYYEDWHYSRHEGLPGITCLWQVSGRSDLDFHKMCILDLYYLRNHNWILDLKISLRTVLVVLLAKGAY